MSSQPQAVGRPPQGEVVTDKVLASGGINAQAFSGADNPSTIWRLMVRDSPSAFAYYRELEAKDLVINAALQTRRDLVLARERGVKAADEKVSQAKDYADAAAAFLDSIPLLDAFRSEVLDAPAYGFTATEILWDTDGARVWVDALKGRPQEYFRFGQWSDPQTGPLLFTPNIGGQGQAVPERKFIVTSSRVRNGVRFGQPILREIFWPSWFVRNGLRADLQFLEKPVGTVVVNYPSGATDEVKKQALEAAEAIVAYASVAIADTFKVDSSLLYSARTRTGQDYKEYIEMLVSWIRIKILGQTLSSQGSDQGAGSRALGDVHLQVLYEIVRRDAQLLEAAVQQLIDWWGVFQFGPQFIEREFRPVYLIEKNPPKDAAAELDRIAKARNLNPPSGIPERVVYEAGIPRPEKSDTLLPPPLQEFVPGIPEPAPEEVSE